MTAHLRRLRKGRRYATDAAFMVAAGVHTGEAVQRAVQRAFDHWCYEEAIDVRGDAGFALLRQFARRFRHRLDEASKSYDATGQFVPDTPNIAARQAVRDMVTCGVLRELF
jgi:hypothetical protein